MIGLLANEVDPSDSTLWETPWLLVHVHVTMPPTATVSTAGLAVPLWALMNTIRPSFPTVTDPAGEREIAVPPRARQQHHVHHRIVGDQLIVLVQVPERPQCHGAVDRGHERGVHLGHAVVVEPQNHAAEAGVVRHVLRLHAVQHELPAGAVLRGELGDRKSTRLNSSHGYISYAVFCLNKT